MSRAIHLFSIAVSLHLAALLAAAEPPPVTVGVHVEILEGVPDQKGWKLEAAKVTERYDEPAFGFVATPRKYSNKGLTVDRSSPFVVRANGEVNLPAGEYRLLLRSHNAARLYLDDQLIAQTEFLKTTNAHESVPDAPASKEAGLRPLPVGHQERIVTSKLEAGKHAIRLEAMIAGQKLRPEIGETCVGIALGQEPFRLVSGDAKIPLSDEGWETYAAGRRQFHHARDVTAKRKAEATEVKYWNDRHELARREAAKKAVVAAPEVSKKMPVHNDVDRFIGQTLERKSVQPAALTDSHAFLRRVTLDTIGINPTPAEIADFAADASPERRAKVIDRLLNDPRWADNWVGYWQDVLAENPGILKPKLNNTGPFRFWIYEAFLDNVAMDRFVTQLVMMEGSAWGGGPAGFAVASENDAPLAAKAHILSKAFLGVELQCARCHDAPFHPFKQQDTFSFAAMLGNGPQTLPVSSTVKIVEGNRKPRVEITLKPGASINPDWPFPELAPAEVPPGVVRDPKSQRERLAAILTSPNNERFAQVIVNRLWKRYLGLGLVEPVDDWPDTSPSHPELLEYLAHELITHDYDLKHVARLILNSHTYQRVVLAEQPRSNAPDERVFASPARRRLSAEQVVDSLYHAVGKEFRCEELNMDPEGRQRITDMLNLGTPRSAWEFTSLSNERDRPALALPIAQGVVDLLAGFGWRDSRQAPLTVRDETPTPLQPLILAHGTVGSRITRLSDDSSVTEICLQDRPLPDVVKAVFLQVLSRPPSAGEQRTFVELLKPGFEARCVKGAKAAVAQKSVTAVSWANHLSPEATKIKMELERAARAGDPPTQRLQADWRERMEDMLWALFNSPEFVFLP